MNKTAVTISLIGTIIAVTLIYFFYQPKEKEKEEEAIIPASWSTHYKYDSRDPYGTYMFYELLKASTFNFEKIEGDPTDRLKELHGETKNKLFVFCGNTYPDYVFLWKELDSFVREGNKILFILEDDPSSLADYYHGKLEVTNFADSMTKHKFAMGETQYEFKKMVDFKGSLYTWNHFSVIDSLWIEKDLQSNYPGALRILGKHSQYYFIAHEEDAKGKPVFIEVGYGEGAAFIHRTPMAFTNLALLEEENVDHLERILDEIDYDGIIFNTPPKQKEPDFNRKEKKSPLQFILASPALSWAYYITIGCLLLFLLFNVKRKQNPIPLTPPKASSTLEFVDALSKIYYQKHNNPNIVKHKYRIFITFIRTHYHINMIKDKTEFARVISVKSGIGREEVEALLTRLETYSKLNEISDEQLIGLHAQLDNFYKNCK